MGLLRSANNDNRPLWLRVLLRCLLALLPILLVLAYLCRRDPTSVFFNQSVGYEPRYSKIREAEADEYLAFVSRSSAQAKVDNATTPIMCVGIPSMARGGPRYFPRTAASILAGLDPSERTQMHLIYFLAHSDPAEHPAYSEGWPYRTADDVIGYEEDQVEHVRVMENRQGMHREKGVFDYSRILQACYDTEARYVVILEDDVLAMDGWFSKAVAAAEEAEERTNEVGYDDYLYLRLFWTEAFFGYNSENWMQYSRNCVVIFICELLVLLAVRRRHGIKNEYLDDKMLLLYLLGFTPMLMILFFAAGRMTLFPMGKGLIGMPEFGCCSQGFLFQRERVPDIVGYLDERHFGFVDSLLEEHAREHDELRWAISPSILQHKGVKSSKDDGTEVSDGYHPIFNFEFEEYDPAILKEEHRLALEELG